MRSNRRVKLVPRAATSLLILYIAASTNPSHVARAEMQEESPLKLRADTRVVEIDVAVRDSRGKPVGDLKQSDFSVTDNGKPRPFTIFSVNRDVPASPASTGLPPEHPPDLPPRPALPRNVFTNFGAPARPPEGHSTIILLDGVNGWFENFAYGRQGVLGVMNKVPADENIAIYVVSNGDGMGILQDYTTDRAKLIEAMTRFIPRGMHPAPPYLPEGAEGMMEHAAPDLTKMPPREKEAYMQRASEAVRLSLQALAERLRALPGRKSVFWITQGFPPVQLRDMNQFGWDKTIAALNDANVEVNTVDNNGLGGPPRYWGPGAILTLQQIAEETGGQAYFHRNDLDAAIASGIADSRMSYTLAFYLTEVDGKYHELKVHVDRPGLTLNYRLGYYARSEAVRDSETRKSDLESALLNPVDSAGVGITAKLDMVPGRPRATLNARLTLDPETLSVKESTGGWTGRVDEMFIERNADGLELARLSDTKQFKIAAEQKQKYDAKGVVLSTAVQLVPGAVKLSVIVRDAASGRTGSLTIPLGEFAPGDAVKQRAP